MDTAEWRDIGFAKWHDPYAILENPHAPETRHTVAEEGRRFHNALRGLHTAEWKRAFTKYAATTLPTSPAAAHESFEWNNHIVKLQHAPGHVYNVWILTKDGAVVCFHKDLSEFAVDYKGDVYATVHDAGNGAELLELCVFRLGVKTPLWKRKPVGVNIAFVSSYLYYMEVENELRYCTVIATDAQTGKGRHVVYDAADRRINMGIHAPTQTGDVYIKTSNALSQRLGRIVGKTVRWITPDPPVDGNGKTLLPISDDDVAENDGLRVGGIVYTFPRASYLVDVHPHGDTVYVVTVKQCVSRLYAFRAGKFTLIRNNVEPSEIALCHFSDTPQYLWMRPNAATEIWNIEPHRRVYTFPEPLAIPIFRHGLATSVDGAAVPYTYVATVKRPRGLLVEGYGAYGSSSKRQYPMHRLAWLEKGYALAVAAPRGGRDDGDAWYDGGRTAPRKHNTFADTAAVIQAVQTRFGFAKAQTVFYGRSAGGWLAAAIGIFYPHLVAAIYAEVPYLDVLRTTSNPKLPLTQLEYDEFGNPRERPEDYAALARISPMENIPQAPLGAPIVLLKTAIHDRQVLPYESLKFAKRLRDRGWTAYVSYDNTGGHFAEKNILIRQQAEDAAILTQALTYKRPRTRKRRSKSSTGTRRRSKSF